MCNFTKKNREIRVTLPSAAVFDTLFENHKKCRIQHSIWQVFEKNEACGQAVLPDSSLLIGQKLVKNFDQTFLDNFQTLYNKQDFFEVTENRVGGWGMSAHVCYVIGRFHNALNSIDIYSRPW